MLVSLGALEVADVDHQDDVWQVNIPEYVVKAEEAEREYDVNLTIVTFDKP